MLKTCIKPRLGVKKSWFQQIWLKLNSNAGFPLWSQRNVNILIVHKFVTIYWTTFWNVLFGSATNPIDSICVKHRHFLKKKKIIFPQMITLAKIKKKIFSKYSKAWQCFLNNWTPQHCNVSWTFEYPTKLNWFLR